MKNNEPITGAIQNDVLARKGRHHYEPLKDVVELTFLGTNCNYVQVIDMKTARELDLQLRKILPPLYEEL